MFGVCVQQVMMQQQINQGKDKNSTTMKPLSLRTFELHSVLNISILQQMSSYFCTILSQHCRSPFQGNGEERDER